MGEKGNEPASDGTGARSGSASGASGASTAGPGTGTGIGSGTGTSTGSGTPGGGGGGSAATQQRKYFNDGWTAASGTPTPGYEDLTPEEEIAELEEGITILNRNAQNKYDYGKLPDAEEMWERAGEVRARQNQLQRQLGLPESGPRKPSAPGSSGAVEP